MEIKKKWLKELSKLSDKAKEDTEKWVKTNNELLPSSVHRLIGYSSTAEDILNEDILKK